MPPVTGKNGYTYTLQELAFFSYFYGGPSFAAGGAYSNNGTLTSDAGAVCVAVGRCPPRGRDSVLAGPIAPETLRQKKRPA